MRACSPKLGVVAAMFATVLGCSPAASERAADNLLFVVFDTTRADHLSAYGYDRVTSPAIDSLAARGALFDRAFSHVPSTLPAHATLFTGLLPAEHGVRCNGKFRLPQSRTTLAEILAGQGFATGAVIGAFPLDARFGIAQGFDFYDDDFASSAVTARRRKGRMDDPGFWIGHDFVDFERGADEVSDLAIAWLSKQTDRWFLFAHYFDPHWPYEPAESWESIFDLPYDAEIAYADSHFGRLLDAAAAMPGRTLVVFTADHGEGLGEHGEALHNRYLYDATLRVPLILALDGKIPARTRFDDAVGHVDVMPTVLDLLGLPAPAGMSGRSLAPLFAGRPLEPKPVYAETLVHSLERPLGIQVRAWIEPPHKLIRTDGIGSTTRIELYDFAADPGENDDLSRRESALADAMRARLDAARERMERNAAVPEPIAIDDATEARLRSLGYL